METHPLLREAVELNTQELHFLVRLAPQTLLSFVKFLVSEELSLELSHVYLEMAVPAGTATELTDSTQMHTRF